MKNDLKKISDSLVLYKISSSYKYLLEVENCLKENFVADGIVFWKYDAITNSMEMLSNTKSESFPLVDSLIKISIENKTSMLLDYVSSNKFYNATIDNPLALKIKSMMIVPMIDNNEILGIVTLYKDIKRGKKFTEYDGLKFKKFVSTLLVLYKKDTENIEDTAEEKSKLNTKNHSLQRLPKENISKEKKNNRNKESSSELELEIKALKNLFSDLEEENKAFKNELKLLKAKEKNKIEALDTKYLSSIEKYKKETRDYKTSIKTYEIELVELKKLVKKQELDLKAYAKSEKEQQKEINKYKQVIDELYQTEKEFQSVHKSMVIKYEKNELKQLKTLEEYSKTIEALKNKISTITQDNKDTNTYLQELNETKDEVVYLKKEIEYFDNEIKKLEKENKNLVKIAEENRLKTQNENNRKQQLQKKNTKENNNLEYILQKVDSIFGVNEQTYMLFELMIFSLNSTENMHMIEEKIQDSKIVPHIVEAFKFENTLKIYKEKYLVSEFIDNIRRFERTIFHSKIKLNITIDKFMPQFFIFDAPKVQSMVLHLLMDLQEFIDHKKPIDMSFTHNTKLLHIEIGGHLPQETGGFLSVLTKKNMVKDISKRPALQVSRKLLNSFDYDIEPLYKEKYYKFILDIPIEIH